MQQQQQHIAPAQALAVLGRRLHDHITASHPAAPSLVFANGSRQHRALPFNGEVATAQLAAAAVLAGAPDLTLPVPGAPERPYLSRWILERCTADNGRSSLSVYIHLFTADDPAIPHDHPWHSTSLLLAGHLLEEWTPIGHEPFHAGHQARRLKPGDVVYRPASHTHRLSITGTATSALTLFVTGPRIREWGFWDQPDGRPPRFIPDREFDRAAARPSP